MVSSLQTYPQYSKIDIKNQCFVNNSYCGGGSCYITILYPNNSLYINNGIMTDQTFFFNYTLPSSIVRGLYPCNIVCCESSICGLSSCDFTIVPSSKLSIYFSQTIYLVIFVLAFIIAFILALYGYTLFSGFIVLILGFALLFSDINIYLSFIAIGMGVVLIFASTKRQ